MPFYKIAGLVVEMNSFGRTVRQAQPYLCEENTPQIVIQNDWRSLQQRQPHLSDEACEYLTTGSSFYRQLLLHDGFLLHSSAVVVDGKAYLFSGPCGTGKSTHTKLWLKTFGDKAYILNDDKPALRLEDGKWYAYGTPWSGKHDISVNTRIPVGGICFLRQAPENAIRPFRGSKAVFAFLEQTARPAGTEIRGQLMDLIGKLMELVPIYQLDCNISREAAILSYETMSGRVFSDK